MVNNFDQKKPTFFFSFQTYDFVQTLACGPNAYHNVWKVFRLPMSAQAMIRKKIDFCSEFAVK